MREEGKRGEGGEEFALTVHTVHTAKHGTEMFKPDRVATKAQA